MKINDHYLPIVQLTICIVLLGLTSCNHSYRKINNTQSPTSSSSTRNQMNDLTLNERLKSWKPSIVTKSSPMFNDIIDSNRVENVKNSINQDTISLVFRTNNITIKRKMKKVLERTENDPIKSHIKELLLEYFKDCQKVNSMKHDQCRKAKYATGLSTLYLGMGTFAICVGTTAGVVAFPFVLAIGGYSVQKFAGMYYTSQIEKLLRNQSITQEGIDIPLMILENSSEQVE